MKKIMFNDRYGLTRAVLDGRKTMTRRTLEVPIKDFNSVRIALLSEENTEVNKMAIIKKYAKYQVGEELAVAQPYKDTDVLSFNAYLHDGLKRHKEMLSSQGYRNKMFVKAEYMPHRIRITDIKVERLQDISEEDAMREGVFKYDKPPLHHECDMFAPWPPYIKPYKWDANNLIYRCTARYAFAYLIDKISGGGTWNRNPWVFAYEFELVR